MSKCKFPQQTLIKCKLIKAYSGKQFLSTLKTFVMDEEFIVCCSVLCYLKNNFTLNV